MQSTCLNLKEHFGGRYKLGVDESYYAERPEFRREDESWLTHIVCRQGYIGVWGNDLLVASTRTAGPTANALKALHCVQIVQDGSDGVNVTFNVEHFDEIAEIMRPRNRRRLAEKQRRQFVEMGAKYRFLAGAQIAPGSPECVERGYPV